MRVNGKRTDLGLGEISRREADRGPRPGARKRPGRSAGETTRADQPPREPPLHSAKPLRRPYAKRRSTRNTPTTTPRPGWRYSPIMPVRRWAGRPRSGRWNGGGQIRAEPVGRCGEGMGQRRERDHQGSRLGAPRRAPGGCQSRAPCRQVAAEAQNEPPAVSALRGTSRRPSEDHGVEEQRRGEDRDTPWSGYRVPRGECVRRNMGRDWTWTPAYGLAAT